MDIEDIKVSKIVTTKPVVKDNKLQFERETATYTPDAEPAAEEATAE
jgi:hypothetical protein